MRARQPLRLPPQVGRRAIAATVSANVAMNMMGMPGTPMPQPVSQPFRMLLLAGAPAPVALAPPARDLERQLARNMGVDADAVEGAMLNWSASFDGHDGDVLMTTGSTDQSGRAKPQLAVPNSQRSRMRPFPKKGRTHHRESRTRRLRPRLNYVFEVMPNSVGPEVGLQMPYYTYGGNDTMYSLWNPGATAQSVVLTLYSSDGLHTYAIPVTLAPDASTMIDVGMLRREGMLDASGNLLPPGVEDGSAMLEPAAAGKPGKNGMIKVPKSGPAEMEVAVSMGIFNAQTATCCTCRCVYTCPAVEDGLGFVGVGQALAATMTAEGCFGILENFTDAATWSDNNGAVLASQGCGAFNALGVGSATLTAQAYLIAGSGTCNGKCHSTLAAPTAPANAVPVITSISPNAILAGQSASVTITGRGFGASPTVNVPSTFAISSQTSSDTSITLNLPISAGATLGNNPISVTANAETSAPANFVADYPDETVVVSDTTTYCSGCATTLLRAITYQVMTFAGNVAANMPIGEASTTGGWSCTYPSAITVTLCGNASTDANGEFTDGWSLNTDASSPTGCGLNFSTNWGYCNLSPLKIFGPLTGFIGQTSITVDGYTTTAPGQHGIPNGTIIKP